MERNIGSIDRVIRGLIGVALITVFFVAPPANVYLGYGALVVGLVLLGTAVFAWCPPYALLGIKTCSIKNADQ